MNRRYYRVGQFARKSSVSIRTLRYYDQVGLLTPTGHSESGYRLYTDDDLPRLQQIMALKYLGFSLDEIPGCLRTGPRGLREALSAQKAMMSEKRAQLETVIQAIEETERVVQAGCDSWDAIVHVMEAMHVSQTEEWQNKYFSPEQRQVMDTLSEQSYAEEARQKLAARGPWTEEDQQRVDGQYAWIGAELKRLVASGADPGSPEAQAVAKLQHELLSQFTMGDPQIQEGLGKMWQTLRALPQEQRPFAFPYDGAEAAFMARASEIFQQRLGEGTAP